MIPDASKMDANTVRCELCGRLMPRKRITLHHLVPKSRGGGPEVRVPTCKPCHKTVHNTFTNKELARDYTTIESLRSAEELQPFLAFIRKQKPEKTITVKSDRRGKRR